MKRYPLVLSIAGSDSGGGAGIQTDIKTISANSAFATTAITAITAQNTCGVQSIFPIPTNIIEAQIEAVMSDIGADCIKIGMLHSAEVVRLVCRVIDRYKPKNVVLDPVMVSTSGHRLIEEEAIELLRTELLPRASLVTPNIPEAEVFLGRSVEGDMEAAARALVDLGCPAVLLKAGHAEGDMLCDILYIYGEAELRRFAAARIETPNTHGTGCTLSSAIAARLACGDGVVEAVEVAKAYLLSALEKGKDFRIGAGHGAANIVI